MREPITLSTGRTVYHRPYHNGATEAYLEHGTMTETEWNEYLRTINGAQDMKPQILAAIQQFAARRPGLEPRNYIRDWNDSEGRANYRRESRSITKDLHHVRALADYVSRSSITADDILEASRRAYSGRLSLKRTAEGYEVDYCTGQYFCTEYRRAAAVVLASAIWYHLGKNHQTADDIRKAARFELGKTLAREFFN